MVNEKATLLLEHDAEQDWKRVLNEPLNGIMALKCPRIRSALHLDRIIRARPNSLTDTLGEGAVEIQPGILRAGNGDRGAERRERVMGEVFRAPPLMEVRR